MKNIAVARLSHLKYVVFDVETTGFSPYKDRIIQIAAMKMDGAKISKNLRNDILSIDKFSDLKHHRGAFNAFVNPGIKIPRRITTINGIENKHVDGKPSEELVTREFIDFVGDRILVAQNGIKFDMKFIDEICKRTGIKFDNGLCLDTMWLSRKLHPEKGLKHGLDAIRERWGVPDIQPRHNALVDVLLTGLSFGKMLRFLHKAERDHLFVL